MIDVSPSGSLRSTKLPKALELAVDVIKQIITLSTTVTVVTITFAKEFRPTGHDSIALPKPLFWSWFCFGLAIAFGLLNLMTIVSETDRIEKGDSITGINTKNVRFTGAITIILFLLGLTLTIFAGAAVVSP